MQNKYLRVLFPRSSFEHPTNPSFLFSFVGCRRAAETRALLFGLEYRERMSKSNLSAIFGDSSDSDSDDDVASGSSSTSGGDAGKVAAVEEKKRAAAPAAPAGGLPSVASLIFSDDSDDSDSDDEDDNANLGAGMSNLKPASSRAGRAKAAAKQRKRGGGGTR